MKKTKKYSQKRVFHKKEFRLPKTDIKFRSGNVASRLEHRRVGD